MTKPPVHIQGTVVIEPDHRGFLVMFPDGDISWQPSRQFAESAAKKWFREHATDGSIGLGKIEWRPR